MFIDVDLFKYFSIFLDYNIPGDILLSAPET